MERPRRAVAAVGIPHRIVVGLDLGVVAHDVVIEATGVPAVWETAIACGRPGSTINLFGGCPKDTMITVMTEQLHYGELTLKGVFHNTPLYVREALALIATGNIDWGLLVSDHRPLKDLSQTFDDMLHRRVIKVAMEP